ncbi:MAG: molybdenum cofactor guanylyltransferase [Hyphomicrobium sp.]|nr:molybdenum cofactor guanylyltransferase [Hyphomicrobium sp.]
MALRPTGVLLAGGRSSRMADAFASGAGDKGLLTLGDRPMLTHVIERLRPQAGKLVINANGDPARFKAFGLPVAADSIEDFAGPLAGILAGMRWSIANAPEATHILSVSTDAPFLPSDLAQRLQEALSAALSPSRASRVTRDGERDLPRSTESAPKIALASSGGELHPVIGLWPVSLADDLDAALKSGTRKVLAWTDRHGTKSVEFPFLSIAGHTVDPFFNANTPDELDEARRLLAS